MRRARHPIPDYPPNRPSARMVAGMVFDYLEAHPGGGTCHAVLEEENVDLGNISWCHDECLKRGDHDGVLLMRLFSCISPTQRRKAVAVANQASDIAGRADYRRSPRLFAEFRKERPVQ
jgi:hypothetical protein